MTAIADF